MTFAVEREPGYERRVRMIPVWLCSDPDDGCWLFISAPTRGAARWMPHDLWTGDRDDAMALSVRRVRQDGIVNRIGGSGPQATVEADGPRELTDAECAALGWRMCVRCGERWARNPDGCEQCLWDPDAALDPANGEAVRP